MTNEERVELNKQVRYRVIKEEVAMKMQGREMEERAKAELMPPWGTRILRSILKAVK